MRWTDALAGLCIRHEILVQEMTLRGFNHKSPLEMGTQDLSSHFGGWPQVFIDLPHDQFYLLRKKYQNKPQGRIALPPKYPEIMGQP